MNSRTYLFLALAAVLCVFSVNGFATENNSRRSFLQKSVAVPSFLIASQLPANAASTKDLVNDLVTSKTKMEVIPDLLQQNEWDKVRTILKTPPVNSLWNLGESQNPLVKLAKETGEFELLELKDELAISLQMCDQLTYDNAFVYFQPGMLCIVFPISFLCVFSCHL